MSDAELIVGCEDGERSAEALELGALLARLTETSLLLVHVFPRAIALSRTDTTRDRGRYERAQHERAADLLDQAEQILGGDLRHRSLAVGAYSVAQGLHDCAEQERARLIVLGSTHRGPVGRILAGEVATALLHGAPCPIAVSPRGYRAPVRGLGSIGVAFDGREEAKLALRAAGALASLCGASLRLVAVAEPPGFGGADLIADASYEHVMEDIRDQLRGALEEARATLPKSLPVAVELLEGRVAPALAENARNLDLLLAGARGYGPLGRVLLGSTAARLTRSAPCPLLVTPRGVEWTFPGEQRSARDHG